MAGYGLSKSRIIAWKQCPKKLWLQVRRPELLDDANTNQQILQAGNEVGEVARQLYPDGILIDDEDLRDALASTQNALSQHPDRPIFEATFQHDGVLVRADLLLPTDNGYRMVEVKSSTSVKPYHIDDCTIQTWVLQQAGIPLDSIELAHIDKTFIYLGDGQFNGLFHHANLDDEVSSLIEYVPEWINGARTTLSGDEPCIEPGAQCGEPFECPFIEYCNESKVYPEYSLDIFPWMGTQKKQELLELGYEDALVVPEEYLNETQKRVQRISRTETPELDPEAGRMLESLPYPRYYLDFETINFVVPRWPNTRPYGVQMTFQWSCHIEESPGNLRHEMFLDVSGADPRRPCAESLVETLKTDGPIFVYNQSFEKSRIAEMAELFPDLASKLLAINDRVVDLLPIARAYYYHPGMRGSWSIKAVLPTVAPELDYASLTVGNGGDAQEAYKEIIHPETPDDRKAMLTEGLREYCKLDTLAMVKLAWYFQGAGEAHVS